MTRSTLRAAFRQLRQDAGYAIAFVLTLGLGIGASTAIFSAVEGVLIRPLPYPHADRIVYVQQPLKRSGDANTLFSFVEAADYRTQASTLDEVVEYGDWTFNLVGLGEPKVVYGGLVTSNYFKVLAIHPSKGRALTPDDDTRGSKPVAVLTYEFWQRATGADPDIVGKSIELTGVPATIVGVLEPGSHYAGTQRAEIYANYPTNAHYMSASMQNERAHRMTDLYALVKDGVPLDRAQADLSAISQRLHTAYPADYPEARGFDITLTPWREILVRNARPTLLVLMGAVGLVLLVACANVGNLTLARLIRRERELAVRAAIGATPGQLRRQLLVEHLVLACAGALLGIAIAAVARGGLMDYTGRLTLRADALQLNTTVLLFSLVVGVAAAMLFAWTPRLPAPGAVTSSAAAGGSGQRSTSGRIERRAQRALVAVQIAISFIVLVGAGLLVRTFMNLQHIDPGFKEEGVLVVNAPNMTRTPPDKNRPMLDEITANLMAFPGVQSVATSSRAPFDVVNINVFYLRTADGRFSQPQPPTQLLTTIVSPSYFSTLGIQLTGRTFGPEETPTAPPSVIINETMAKLAFAGHDPINQRLEWSFDGTTWGKARTVIAVAKDARELGGGQTVVPTVFESATQYTPGQALMIRTADRSGSVGREAARLIHDRDPKRPVTKIAWLTESAAERVAPSRLNAALFGGFAILALTIAAIGVGGVLAFSITERTREFGIRMALGAEPLRILRGVLGEGLVLAGAGVVIGVAGALFLSRFLSGLLYEVTPLDALTFAATCGSLTFVALLAAWVPARRATKVQPTEALRAT
jgi:putative ABC transport system permease protein